jgi:hypothetical protein
MHTHTLPQTALVDVFGNKAGGTVAAGWERYLRKQKNPAMKTGFSKLERETRLELATPTLARSCSTN